MLKLYDSVTVFGRYALFTRDHVNRNDIPSDYYMYEVSGDEYNSKVPVAISFKANQDFCGTIIMKDRLYIEPRHGVLFLDDDNDFVWNGVRMTIQDYEEDMKG